MTATGTTVLDGLAGQGAMPRVLVVMAHPDDEVLAVGAQMERMAGCRFVCVTDGAPEDGADASAHGFASLTQYRAARRWELACALGSAGLPASVAGSLVLDDGNAVPDQRAAGLLAEITRAIRREIEAFHPEMVLTHPYEGGHPDHDATAFAAWAAVQSIAEPQRPLLAEAVGYHAGTGGQTVWMKTGQFLPRSDADDVRVCHLRPEQQEKKRALLGCFSSQAETLGQFGVEREAFRLAPAYCFGRAPHEGVLLYEAHGWGGLTGAEFRSRAIAAMQDLGL